MLTNRIKIKKSEKSVNYAISQLFSPRLAKSITCSLEEKNIKSFLKNCQLYSSKEKWKLSTGLETAYNYLKCNYRCEYVYKNEIANQLLLAHHNDNSATLLKEVSSDNSIADIVIVNGETVAYEIKTELDSFDRLKDQLISYDGIYDKVYVVTHPGAINTLNNYITADVGIIVLNNKGVLEVVKEARSKKNDFVPQKAVWTLRQSELVNAYKNFAGNLPQMGSALIHSFCLNWYISLDKKDAHNIFYLSLKSRRPASYQFDLVKNSIPALRILFLGQEISNKICMDLYNKICIFD